MRISELILDGFKSYPVRTAISGFDGSFNAVTGLNGSGKSNILDAICFVLGITNLSAVRATNLQDLIYKRGQAGVTKASVTVVFDNADREKAPVGFEEYKEITVTRQIAMGGTSKYLINGHRATQQAVQNLFQSVQLNINNPNFLIMQGKITKVLNMKPQEILGMIEEAAGTSMFEERKDKAIRTMAKKDKKMDEIQELLKDEIEPKLDRLRGEKRTYLEYQQVSSELERLSRLVVAYDWTGFSQKLAALSARATEVGHSIGTLEEDKDRLGGEIVVMRKEQGSIQKRMDKESTKGGKVERLKKAVDELATELAKLKTQAELARTTVKDEDSRVAELSKTATDLRSSHAERTQETASARQAFVKLKTDFDLATDELRKAEELLQTLVTGLSSKNGAEDAAQGGYMGQLAQARQKLADVGSEAEQAKVRIGHLNKELKEKEPRARKMEKEGGGLVAELAHAKKELDALEAELSKLDWDEAKGKALAARREDVVGRLRSLKEQRAALKSKLGQLDFSYSDPSPDFDRSKVKGLVATLVTLDPASHSAATALEVCAGGRLYNVVIEDHVAASALLDKGKLQRKVTMIPLNQIKAFVASAEQLSAATKASSGRAKLALELIGYDDEVAKAMQFVFGGTLICPDAETAKRTTFDKNVQLKSVTFDGDVYDPQGTLSGGAKPQSAGVLVKAQEVRKLDEEIKKVEKEADKIEKEWTEARATRDRFAKGNKALEIKRHEVGLLQERVEESNATRIVSEVAALKTTIAELNEVVAASKSQQKAAEAECKRLQKEMDDFKNNRDSKLNEIKADIAKRKADISKRTNNVKTVQREVQTAEAELEQLANDIQAAEKELAEAKASATKAKADAENLEKESKATKARHVEAEAHFKEETKILDAFRQELADLDKAIKGKEAEIAAAEGKVIELGHEAETVERERKAAQNAVVKLEQKWEWIPGEKKNFGKSGTDFDFESTRMGEQKKRVEELQERHQGMKKKVNPKVLDMIDSVEKKEKDLRTMHTTVIKDKGKIEETIARLDEYKLEALTKAWEIVNSEFGVIFDTLLPGNWCELQPPEGMSISQGLEVRVRLGSTWKSSLTELSGGQRSLIALSLIMSLLKTHPSPLYVLDEVDAALDLQHTQNLGLLFKNRFKGSQFIVVSLKEGLFTNANVLFRTRFRDGTSVVERTASRSASSLYDADKENATGRAATAASKGRGAARQLQTVAAAA